MKEKLQKLIELKFETDSIISKIEVDNKKIAEKIKAQRTEILSKIVDDLSCIYQVAKEFKLTESGGFYRLKTPIQSIVYPEYKLDIILYDNCPHRFRISARKQDGYLISWMGYSEEWGLTKEKGFPLIVDKRLSPYSTEVLNLMEKWENTSQAIEEGLVLDCNTIIQRKLEYANTLL